MIKIVWIINEKFINNLVTVYNEVKKDKRFELTVIASPRLGAAHCDEISSAENAEYIRSKGIPCIDCYEDGDQDGACVDLRNLAPDYVFRSTQYDLYYPEPYHSHVIAGYSKLCIIEYGAWLIPLLLGPSFDVAHFFFCSFDHQDIKLKGCPITPVGNLKLDEYLYYGREPRDTLWSKEDRLKVLWKPRWTVVEDSTLFEHIVQMYDYLKNNEFVELVFLVHPMLYSKLRQLNRYEEFEEIHNKLLALPNYRVDDSDDFLDSAYTCDVLIADVSSTIAECAIFGREIIFTEKAETNLNSYGQILKDDSYEAHSFEDIESAIKDIFDKKKAGLLPRNKHKAMQKYMFVPPDNISIAQYMLKQLHDDYYSIAHDILTKIYEQYPNTQNNKELNQYIYRLIANNEKILTEKLREISFLEEANEIQKARIRDLELILSETQKNIGDLEIVLSDTQKNTNDLELMLSEMYGSTSWRITKPLRSVLDWLRGNKQG